VWGVQNATRKWYNAFSRRNRKNPTALPKKARVTKVFRDQKAGKASNKEMGRLETQRRVDYSIKCGQRTKKGKEHPRSPIRVV